MQPSGIVRSIVKAWFEVTLHWITSQFPSVLIPNNPDGNAARSLYMNPSPYRDNDHSFGQTMLTLRSAIGLTQTELSDFLGVSRRTVGAWESGSKYPKAEHLKHFIALAVEN